MRPIGPGLTLVTTAVLSCVCGSTSRGQSGQEPIRRWLIAPAAGRAEITATSSLADLEGRFGQKNVRQAKIHLGEGGFVDGTVIYADDPVRRVDIVWKDGSRHAPAILRVRGKESQWGVAPGISLGTSLKVIEGLNGGPFTLTGFGYDYSGTIVDWNGGRLASLRSRVPHAFIRLEPSRQVVASMPPDYIDVVGDRDFSSSRAAMQRLNPRVYELVVSYQRRD